MSTVAEKVRAAADYIDANGLHKGSMSVDGWSVWDDPEGVVRAAVPCCTIGTFQVFGINDDEVRIPFAKKIGAYVSIPDVLDPSVAYEYDDIADWNDRPERTKEDVVTALRELADELEQGAALTE